MAHTAKSISISGETYRRLREHCKANRLRMSRVVESLLEPVIGARPRKRRSPKGPT